MSGEAWPDETSSSDARVGATVADKYVIGEVLGSGGMGAVHRATHRELDEPVAVKFLHRMYASTPELRTRFRREAIALARLRHRGVVALLDFGEHEGEPFMVMEVVGGRSLRAVIEEASLSVPFVAMVADQILEVLEVAHAAGIIHRDIKPSNVMVVSPAQVKLLDFGLAHLPGESVEKLTSLGVVRGTPDYMSPEQCQGEIVGPATDVYALGVMIYECLAGTTPFDGEGAAQLMAQHLFVDPPSVMDQRPDAPIGFDDLLRRSMAKVATARPTAVEMRAELAAIVSGTDPLAIAHAASRERARSATMSRGDRAITGAPPARRAVFAPTASVSIRIDDAARASRLRSALAVAGISSVLSSDQPSESGVIIVSARDGAARLAAAVAEGAPVLVVDVRDATETRECIRGGASDMHVVDADDAEIAAKTSRLLRRRR